MKDHESSSITIAGYSGHGLVVVEAAVAAGLPVQCYTDQNQKEFNPFGLDYLGCESEDDFQGWESIGAFILGVGDNRIRRQIAKLIEDQGKELLRVIHPAADIAKPSTLGQGVFVARNVSVSPMAVVGDYSILNTACVVEHECVIGRASHIAPGAVLTGNVHVGDHCLIGANATVVQGVTIGDGATVGAGAVVLKDVPAGKTVIGNPATIR